MEHDANIGGEWGWDDDDDDNNNRTGISRAIFDRYAFVRFFCQEGLARIFLGVELLTPIVNSYGSRKGFLSLKQAATRANRRAQARALDKDTANRFTIIGINRIEYRTRGGIFLIEEIKDIMNYGKISMKYEMGEYVSHIFNNERNVPRTKITN
jgi:hypothetical protein